MRGASMYPERSITTQGKSMSEFAVELRGIRKKYGRVTAVESIDLAVSEGEFLSFLGPSGCGKTTTLRMIAGLEAPSEGDILIKGQRSEEHTSELQSLMRISYAVFRLKKKTNAQM